MNRHEEIMLRAISLAQKGTGLVATNPRVGAVITKNGKILAEGWHLGYGKAHAEVNAIENSKGIDIEGAELYVSLEPCSHVGKTPACTSAIVQKKFSKVYVALKDPNPLVNGQGIKILKENGIKVEVGILEEEAKWINRAFIKNINSGFTYNILKIGQSIDGSIATFNGESRWITSPQSRKIAHALRNEFGGILVGKNTVNHDNPALDVRAVNGFNPIRIIFDTNLEIPLDKKVYKDSNRKLTYVVCSKKSQDSRKARNLKVAGINLISSDYEDGARLTIRQSLNEIAKRANINSVMIEGGSKIIASCILEDIIDEIHLFIAPIIIGKGINGYSEFFTDKIQNAPRFIVKSQTNSGGDLYTILVKNKIF